MQPSTPLTLSSSKQPTQGHRHRYRAAAPYQGRHPVCPSPCQCHPPNSRALPPQVIGTAIALLLLTKGAIPLWGGVLLAAGAAYLMLFLANLGVRYLEVLFEVLIAGKGSGPAFKRHRLAPLQLPCPQPSLTLLPAPCCLPVLPPTVLALPAPCAVQS